jgi:hypothetical protein
VHHITDKIRELWRAWRGMEDDMEVCELAFTPDLYARFLFATMPEAKALIVAISGCSSSGKTTLARLLRDIFPNTFILHQDDFYKEETEYERPNTYQALIHEDLSTEQITYQEWASRLGLRWRHRCPGHGGVLGLHPSKRLLSRTYQSPDLQ